MNERTDWLLGLTSDYPWFPGEIAYTTEWVWRRAEFDECRRIVESADRSEALDALISAGCLDRDLPAALSGNWWEIAPGGPWRSSRFGFSIQKLDSPQWDGQGWRTPPVYFVTGPDEWRAYAATLAEAKRAAEEHGERNREYLDPLDQYEPEAR